MKKIWAWIVSMMISLLLLLRIVIHQRDNAREKNKRSKIELEAEKAIRDSERRIAKMQREAQLKAQQVGDELYQNRDQRPDDNFGDSRIRMRQHNKD